MYALENTIAALATVSGKSALNVIRVSGKASLDIYFGLTKKRAVPKPNNLHVSKIYSASGDVIDQSMIVYYRSPKSFTGEHMLELMVHGGPIIIKQALLSIYKLGATEASPGEFTYRAFINNKISLIQAEAIQSLVASNSSMDNYYHLNTLLGKFSDQLHCLRKETKALLVFCEHVIDFEENDVDINSVFFKTNKKIKKIISQINEHVHCSITIDSETSLNRVAIVGYPNAGKSSLYNLLIGENKSIVTNIEGTTRDSVESSIWIKEHNVVLIDTAGIRKSKDKIEQLGIEKTFEQIKKASFVLVVDEKNPKKLVKKLGSLLNEKRVIQILNKADLNKGPVPKPSIAVSCKNKTGLKELITFLSTSIHAFSNNKGVSVFGLNSRQLRLLTNIKKELEQAVLLSKQKDFVLYVSKINYVFTLFNTLISPSSKNEIINQIFKGFCVGK